MKVAALGLESGWLKPVKEGSLSSLGSPQMFRLPALRGRRLLHVSARPAAVVNPVAHGVCQSKGVCKPSARGHPRLAFLPLVRRGVTWGGATQAACGDGRSGLHLFWLQVAPGG